MLSSSCCVSAAESQASHGKQNVGIGYMSPLLVLGGPGILLARRELLLRAFRGLVH